MILSCHNITKAFGTDVVLKNVSFHIEEHEKAAIVGINGAGKSTLLKIIIGEITPDSGEVTVSRGRTLGYLAQINTLSGHRTIWDETAQVKQKVIDMEESLRTMERQMSTVSEDSLNLLMDQYHKTQEEYERLGGYAWKSEVSGVLKGLGFTEEEFGKPADSLSGGQKTRVALGKLLLQAPDILLLDEPINHLDLNSIEWLENYLLNYQGSVIVVAHDRYFLNKVVTKVVEIDNGTSMSFSGNYSAYAEKKRQLRETQLKSWMNQQAEIRHQEAVIEKLKSFNREKSIKRAESREKMLNKIERIDKPAETDARMHLQLTPRILSGNDVLTVEHLSKSFPGQMLFNDLNFEIKRQEKVALIGSNGTGKTTILKILNEVVKPDAGTFSLGSRVQIGYYDQEHQVL
ncbi:MAG: ATP-binding cassette domain-containing protein, partial [Lachnospiraceae bacterium]|nr:ATP-binding cassette domain-containing protein [Lachnospiraceae bacterium]